MEYLWIAATVGAALAQTLRNALQRGLVTEVGVIAATQVRFLFGLPFAVAFLVIAATVAERAPPVPDGLSLAWIALGALAQIGATALMLAAMQRRSFVVTTAYTKTEPVQVLVVASIVLGEVPTWPLVLAVLAATWGVLLLTRPKGAQPSSEGAAAAAALGLASGGLFALSAVAYRGGILALGGEGDLLAAVTALVTALTLQALLLGLWLLARNRAALAGILAAWRPSATAGLMGALASLGWFVAFALAETAAVRTLGLVELIFAQVLSRRLFQERTTGREWIGLLLLVAGVALVLNVGAS